MYRSRSPLSDCFYTFCYHSDEGYEAASCVSSTNTRWQRRPELCQKNALLLAGLLLTLYRSSCHLTHPSALKPYCKLRELVVCTYMIRPSSYNCNSPSSTSFKRVSLPSKSPIGSRKLAHLLAGWPRTSSMNRELGGASSTWAVIVPKEAHQRDSTRWCRSLFAYLTSWS
jgi:hypothetical protein